MEDGGAAPRAHPLHPECRVHRRLQELAQDLARPPVERALVAHRARSCRWRENSLWIDRSITLQAQISGGVSTIL